MRLAAVRRNALGPLLVALVLAMVATSASAAEMRLGIEPFYFTGRHYEPGNNLSGTAPGLFLEARHHAGRFELKVEGIPAISVRSANAGPSGVRESESIGIFNSDLRFYPDRTQHCFVSFGEAITTQSALANGYGHVDSRVVGPRYGAGVWLDLPRGHFFESEVAVMRLHGTVSYRALPFQLPFLPAAENGSNVEVIVAAGARRGPQEYLVGLHSYNFAMNFDDGSVADQNVAVGLFGEYRYVFGRR